MPKEETEAETAETGEGSFDIDDRRRLKQMAYVTSGCGKNKEKDRVVSTFWEVAWPRLVKLGWKKVRRKTISSTVKLCCLL